MAIVATFSLPIETFPIGVTLGEINGSIEIERVVPIGVATTPFIWIRGSEQTDLTDIAAEIDDSDALELVDIVDDGVLYRVAFDDPPPVIVALREADATVLEAIAHDDRWIVRIRANDADGLSTFHERCLRAGIDADLTGLSGDEGSLGELFNPLTDEQRDAITLAFERGYYDRPRRASLGDLGAELNISRQAVAGRLRRGHRNLVAAALGLDEHTT